MERIAIFSIDMIDYLISYLKLYTRKNLIFLTQIKVIGSQIIFLIFSKKCFSDTIAVCFVCDEKLIEERTRVCSSITPYSNSPFKIKICELMGEDFVVIANNSDYMCKECASLLIQIDKLDHELPILKINFDQL